MLVPRVWAQSTSVAMLPLPRFVVDKTHYDDATEFLTMLEEARYRIWFGLPSA